VPPPFVQCKGCSFDGAKGYEEEEEEEIKKEKRKEGRKAGRKRRDRDGIHQKATWEGS
jgi:hypothetical protein